MTGSLTYLNIAAHPDDLDFGAAGTTAKLTAEGNRVEYCLVTDGEAGGDDASMARSEMARIRRREQTSAAKIVGVDTIHFLGFPDGAVVSSLELRQAITGVIRKVKPDRVITQSPYWNLDRIYASHPDHLATGEAAMAAVYPDSRNQFAFPELVDGHGLEPHTVQQIWLMGGPEPNLHVDITDTIDLKIDALLCHESQIKEPDRMNTMLREWARVTADSAGLPEGRLAESFRKVDTV